MLNVCLCWFEVGSHVETDSLLNLSPLKIVVSKKIASETDISAVNLIFELCLFACSMNWLTTYLLVYMREIAVDVAFPNERPYLAFAFQF